MLMKYFIKIAKILFQTLQLPQIDEMLAKLEVVNVAENAWLRSGEKKSRNEEMETFFSAARGQLETSRDKN